MEFRHVAGRQVVLGQVGESRLSTTTDDADIACAQAHARAFGRRYEGSTAQTDWYSSPFRVLGSLVPLRASVSPSARSTDSVPLAPKIHSLRSTARP